ncbi:MAG TPA: hypothetical protein PLF54_10430 [Deltaproteobacteria bacterium]|nr:hypothetical protein [Deltaproteobacteria bacterium]
MILHPAVIALVIGSALVCLMILTASFFACRIAASWDPQSGSEKQIGLEKKTYLVSMLVAYAFGFQILSFFLFIYTADDLHGLFAGAMCGAGTLNVNRYAYPSLTVKAAAFILAGLWLIMNHADSLGRDYPLTRAKYLFLLLLAPLVLADVFFEGAFFVNLKADVITSCCGSLFSSGETASKGSLSAVADLPVGPLKCAFYGSGLLTLVSGTLFLLGFRRLGVFFSASSSAFFMASAAAFVSFLCLYFYELPTHHCPFCILQGDYHSIGYLLYGALFGGAVSGLGVGLLAPFGRVKSLAASLPPLQKRLSAMSLILYFIFIAIVAWQMLHTDFVLDP